VRHDGHRRIRYDGFVGRSVLGAEFELPQAGLAMGCQPVDLETKVREYVVIDDVVEEYGVGIECVPGQDDAIVEIFAIAADNLTLP
jgi:hypothetical protein